MFYDYYAFNPKSESSKSKFLSSATVYRKKHFPWYKNKQKVSRCDQHKYEAKEIPQEAVMELFDMHHNRTPQRCFEEFFPLYPKSSSVLVNKYKVPNTSESCLGTWFSHLDRSSYARLLTKIFIECDFELKVFNELNQMNEFPMIEAAPKAELRKDKLVEDLLLFLTNIRLRDILKLKKTSYQVWTEEYEERMKSSSEELLKVEDLFVLDKEIIISSSSSSQDTYKSISS